MNFSGTDSDAIDPSKSPSVYFCPAQRIYTWILTETAAFYVSISIKSIASPLTVLLNLLIIFAVGKQRALRKGTHIFLASMAVADLLVGAISMPLTTALDILLLRKELTRTICKIAYANQIVLYSAVASSLYHLAVIAWDRYRAIKKWRSYKVVVTKTRIKICAVVAWLLAAVTAILVPLLNVAKVDQKTIAALSIFSASKTVLSVFIIAYFYISLFLFFRKRRDHNTFNNVSANVNARLEKSIAKATGTVTAALLVSYVPSIIVLYLGDAVPFLRTSSYFRWSELLIQMNSLFNPVVYCFSMNRTFRNEVLKMINMNTVSQPVRRPNSLPAERRIKRNPAPAVVFEEGHAFQEEKQELGGIARPVSIEWVDPQCQIPGAVANHLPSTGERLQVIYVDVHQPDPSATKPRLTQVDCASKEGNPGQSGERNDEIPSTCMTQQIPKRPEPAVVSCGNDHENFPDRNRAKVIANVISKEEKSENCDNDNQSLSNDEPGKLRSPVLPSEKNWYIFVHADQGHQAKPFKPKRQIWYTRTSREVNLRVSKDADDCVGDFPNADVTRARSWPRRVSLELTSVLGPRRNIQLEAQSLCRPNTV